MTARARQLHIVRGPRKGFGHAAQGYPRARFLRGGRAEGIPAPGKCAGSGAVSFAGGHQDGDPQLGWGSGSLQSEASQ